MIPRSKEPRARSYRPVHGGYPGKISGSIKKKPASTADYKKKNYEISNMEQEDLSDH